MTRNLVTKAAGCIPAPATTANMLHTVFAVFWGLWAIYMMVQGFRQKTTPNRIGYFLSSILSVSTSYLLVNP